jgi:hypothetical protein
MQSSFFANLLIRSDAVKYISIEASPQLTQKWLDLLFKLKVWQNKRQKQRNNHQDHRHDDEQPLKALGTPFPDLSCRNGLILDNHGRDMGFGFRPTEPLIQPMADKKYNEKVNHPE